ncbi:MAG: hypothetical protein WDZ69_00740 [Candidatus Pacearchaeota archaeon]
MNKKEITLYVLMAILIVFLMIMTFFPGMVNAVRDSGKSGDDLCNPGPGYTEEEWREHMSHHPNIYSECLS